MDFKKNPNYKSLNASRYEPNDINKIHTATIKKTTNIRVLEYIKCHSPNKHLKNIELMVGF
jgi:hypothetical protein